MTPILDDDELRERGDAARNYVYDASAKQKRRGEFYNHIKAAQVKQRIDGKLWRDLFKFSIERNPWDRLVSIYHWREQREGEVMSFDDFMATPRARNPNFNIYSIDGRNIADFIIRFERLQDDFNEVMRLLGLEPKVLPRAKGNARPKGRHYSEYYTPETRKLVEKWCAPEIEIFGYRFEEA